MTRPPFPSFPRRHLILVAIGLAATVLWWRWPAVGFEVWNVDEAIHAAVARTLLDGGVLYRDAIDQRTPLSYYAVAGLFALCGENNIAALHIFAALLIAATALLLGLIGRMLRVPLAGGIAALLYPLLGSGLFYAGDANALNTEWFVAFFTSAAAFVFLRGENAPSPARLAATGALLGLAFLSKQPALLELGAPALVAGFLALRTARDGAGEEALRGVAPRHEIRRLTGRLLALGAGWALPVGLVAAAFASAGALREAVFYTWTYNLTYYGPEIAGADRVASAGTLFRLLTEFAPLGLLAALGTAGWAGWRVAQRQPTPNESATNPALLYVLAWALLALGAAASGGRGYEHYFIQTLPPVCLLAGIGIAGLAAWARDAQRTLLTRALAGLAFAAALAAPLWQGWQARHRSQPVDPSVRVSAYIKAHTTPADKIFVWGYHPDIYLFADRRPASRFVYASFISGLVPWTNTAPDRDTRYAIVPGTLETLLQELTAQPPAFIVDCSFGPNRSWDKYPLEKFPALRDFVRQRYELTEGPQFIGQGFGLYRLRPAAAEGAATSSASAPAALPSAEAAKFTLPTLAQPLTPTQVIAPNGAVSEMRAGRREFFAHAPSQLHYEVPAGATAIRGVFGFREGAYAPENQGATDGAVFSVVWRDARGGDAGERVLFRQGLRPREEAADRGPQFFRAELPAPGPGRLELRISPGPAENPASDWTYWADLALETYH